jgi:hypothetical protein
LEFDGKAQIPEIRVLFDADVDTTGPAGPTDEHVTLHEAAQTRYLNYALSVITSRALPDVRDGLKPFSAASSSRCGSRT